MEAFIVDAVLRVHRESCTGHRRHVHVDLLALLTDLLRLLEILQALEAEPATIHPLLADRPSKDEGRLVGDDITKAVGAGMGLREDRLIFLWRPPLDGFPRGQDRWAILSAAYTIVSMFVTAPAGA